MSWLDRVPLGPLLIITAMLGLAPFTPEPHLWEKLKLLAAGQLARPIDIFDLTMHGAPVLLLALKLGRLATRRKQPAGSEPSTSPDETTPLSDR